ncbi:MULTISPECIES: 50S ribosomal protein L29 [Chroococcidiopsis]|jgi:large subunit ribosomal protein L29|uniref:Large ribosomal subunit protein uL29 n=2 Tax=Chroococcidiopsis TaxID=54298 RepID=K9TTL0_CHRTP|nr:MULTISPECIES: 50S ribosomal protein L29 [Chroococcidiopsis]MBE9020776.1 50S ribosomal protein L29 [Chroococcidiopsidales cyanobacterium LEGE 13417]OWY67958.1 50S ribosomal protein L29 [cyanobacterium TDX16]PSB41732.1 50S ribosomal protein L29 [Cyanosarcina cf. burmensis CCALA 770]AFY85743.1 LSU ribosomal protein L29P [Chroococcidiopsis thermalis PCC 7203]MBD2306152.1 50S ribosomal protein L29 [Chroococcidiopsis sp. [FACHB-1243]]
MPLPKISEARELTDEQLATEIIAIKKQLFSLRLQKATRQLEKPHQIKHAKHRLGQLLTVERERQLANTNEAEPATEE